ncbi:MAG: molybdenum transporter substrate-binding protein [Gammaproteobacteria bacterium]|nr:molybdenum transporter substrate-binding protein [Gammaproteobacteria bacterium]
MPPRELKLISSMATREILGEIVARFQRDAAAHSVFMEAAGGVDVAKRVQAGEAMDLVVLASNVIDKLMSDNTLLAGSRVDLVKSGIAVAVQAGRPKPPIGSENAVREAVLAARTLSFSTGPSGVHLEMLLQRWGIFDRIRGRVVVPPPGTAVGSLVARGAAELGFQQTSELMNVAGIELVGPLPPEIQSITIFSGAISAACRDPAAARSLLSFMASPVVAGIKQRHGMEAV